MLDSVLLRYAQAQTPRYTSYPTAPHFTPAVDGNVYADWLRSLTAGLRGSLYLHVPFCREMCWYCGCHTRATRQSGPVEYYMDQLEREVAYVAAHVPYRLAVDHIHWGGGSPTLAGPKRLAQAMALIRNAFAVSAQAEVAIEVDPRTMTDALADAFAGAGFNRASLGVQTFDATVQQAINRVQSFDETRACVERLRKAGIDALNMDLLYGLPHQTVESCRDTVARVLELHPDRLAVFGYAHVPHMKKHQQMIDEASLPDAQERIGEAVAFHQLLTEAGYVAIGFDHYARPDDPLAVAARTGRLHRNFQGYCTDDADVLLGFGASAIGCLPQGYVQNEPVIGRWENAIAGGELATVRGIALEDEDRLRGEIIERLMCDLTVDPHAIAESLGQPVPDADLSDLVEAGVVMRKGAEIEIAPQYRLLARNVAAAFDARLGVSAARHSKSV